MKNGDTSSLAKLPSVEAVRAADFKNFLDRANRIFRKARKVAAPKDLGRWIKTAVEEYVLPAPQESPKVMARSIKKKLQDIQDMAVSLNQLLQSCSPEALEQIEEGLKQYQVESLLLPKAASQLDVTITCLRKLEDSIHALTKPKDRKKQSERKLAADIDDYFRAHFVTLKPTQLKQLLQEVFEALGIAGSYAGTYATDAIVDRKNRPESDVFGKHKTILSITSGR